MNDEQLINQMSADLRDIKACLLGTMNDKKQGLIGLVLYHDRLIRALLWLHGVFIVAFVSGCATFFFGG